MKVLIKSLLLVFTFSYVDCIWWRHSTRITEEPKRIIRSKPLLDPPAGQRCSGRNYQERRCCTPETPCNEGEGDCDGPGDGGGHDGHEGCKGDLECGSNNCKIFGLYFHEKDDCCEKPSNNSKKAPTEVFIPGTPFEPKEGQRCRGRNYEPGRRCCTPEEPCNEGEGDCDGPDDGGQHDGHLGCKDDLVCGTNNCKKFGAYYHPKDDCCEKPSSPFIKRPIKKPKGEIIIVKELSRCRGRNFDKGRCCTNENPCVEGEGDCEVDGECNGDLVCGNNNCKGFGSFFHEKDDCCVKTATNASSNKVTPNFPLTEPYQGQRCSGRNNQGRRCCTPENPCDEGEGDCDGPSDGGGHDGNAGCKGDLVCGSNNCKKFGTFYHEKDDCCEKPSATPMKEPETVLYPGALLEPPPGQNCSGRNYQGRRCCTPEEPCHEGEGDCDGPGDGGQHDGHAGCRGDLVCGSNNCKKFGTYYHEKDDCCENPAATPRKEPETVLYPGALLEPPPGQNCSGRNYQGRRCCTPEEPCHEGEGDCDGPGDGGQHDGHAGCRGDLVCGSNNCKKFGAYFHEKDDCCEKPADSGGWGDWEAWSQCSKNCGVGIWSRERHCTGAGCRHRHQLQERFCNTAPCSPLVRNKPRV
eukprot:GFUD01041829.1.p1 GENE.GFUD01041829.1~~GFUD01041829.1.p1  ORF type:complete len:633 (+),score=149.63 GFUD01041829.1:55-1953(+)